MPAMEDYSMAATTRHYNMVLAPKKSDDQDDLGLENDDLGLENDGNFLSGVMKRVMKRDHQSGTPSSETLGSKDSYFMCYNCRQGSFLNYISEEATRSDDDETSSDAVSSVKINFSQATSKASSKSVRKKKKEGK